MEYRNRTEQIIMEGRTAKGGYTHEQFKKWGLDPYNLGKWKKRLIEADALNDHKETDTSSISEALAILKAATSSPAISLRSTPTKDLSTPWGRLTQKQVVNPPWSKLKRHYGYVYFIEHIPTGKGYVGMHRIPSSQEAWDHYMGSSDALNKLYAIEPKTNFEKSLLATASSETEIVFLEGLLIVAFAKTGAPCFNGGISAFRNMVFGSKKVYAPFRKKYAEEIRRLRLLLTPLEHRQLSPEAARATQGSFYQYDPNGAKREGFDPANYSRKGSFKRPKSLSHKASS